MKHVLLVMVVVGCGSSGKATDARPPTDAAVVEPAFPSGVRRLDDVLLRRSGWHYYHPSMPKAVEQVANWMAELLDWSPAQLRAELDAYYAIGRLAPVASAASS